LLPRITELLVFRSRLLSAKFILVITPQLVRYEEDCQPTLQEEKSMNDIFRKYPPLFILACLLLGTGLVGAAGTLLIQPPAPILKPLLLLSVGCTLLGTGEILNHPIERHLVAEAAIGCTGERICRPRNDCSLGNWLDIGGLLLIFVGIARCIYPQ
jgi:hypothetical protein